MGIIINLVIGFIILSIVYGFWAKYTPQGRAYEKKFKEEEAKKKEAKRLKKLGSSNSTVFSSSSTSSHTNTFGSATNFDDGFFMEYTSDSGRTTSRNILIEDLYKKHGEWYLDAHDVDKNAPRTFRVDRINSLMDGLGDVFIEFNDILRRLKKG